MVLQHIVWPEGYGQAEKELYYHGTPEHTENGLLVEAGKRLVFNTYFNSFAGLTWLENTVITHCEFQIELTGKGKAFLKADNEEIISEILFCGECSLCIPVEKIEKKTYYLEVLAEEATLVQSGKIVTSQTGKKVHLLLVTCTYNRQEEIRKNLAVLQCRNKALLDGEKVLDGIYVIDNARNLTLPEQPEDVTLFQNPNTGGAGGFTRGLKEAVKNPAVTHVLLMDDDVRIEFEAIVRTKSMLQYIKKEKEEAFVGGAMFRRDVPYVLHAAGEIWNDGNIINPHKNTDLRTAESVRKVMEPLQHPQTYAGWWYCCIPRGHVEKHGYPMPFFLHCDDIEYSLRSGMVPVFLNGIAVWHEEFDDKRSSVIEYYDTRNRLTTNAIYMKRGKRRNAARILAERFLASTLRYRYKDIEMLVWAVEDFMKGPEWLEKLDAEAYHKKLSECGYKAQPLDAVATDGPGKAKNKLWAILRYFLPASGKAVLKVGALVSEYAGKKEVVLVDAKAGKGFGVEKSWKETLKYAGMLAGAWIKLMGRYPEVDRTWNEWMKQN